MPLNLNTNEVTGVDLNNTEVSEVRLNGQTVFSAQTLPVAYSNLIAWYPFDSATYGGSNADDVTALLNPGQSGDSTAYDGTVNGATYQSSGGVTDINAGANSGAFDFDGSDDSIQISDAPGLDGFSECTIMAWVNFNTDNDNCILRKTGAYTIDLNDTDEIDYSLYNDYSFDGTITVDLTTLTHIAITWDGSANQEFVDGNNVGSNNTTNGNIPSVSDDLFIGINGEDDKRPANGIIEDVRIYNTALSGSQINQIYQNTKP